MTLTHTILPDLTVLGSRRKTRMHRPMAIKTLSINTVGVSHTQSH